MTDTFPPLVLYRSFVNGFNRILDFQNFIVSFQQCQVVRVKVDKEKVVEKVARSVLTASCCVLFFGGGGLLSHNMLSVEHVVFLNVPLYCLCIF